MSKPRGAIVESRDGPLRRLVLILRSIAGIQPLTARSWWNLKKQSFRDGFWKNPLAQEQLLLIDANINRRRRFTRNPSDIESVTITEHAALLLVWWIAYESHIRAIAASCRLPIAKLEKTIRSALPAREMAKRARLAIDEVQRIRLELTKKASVPQNGALPSRRRAGQSRLPGGIAGKRNALKSKRRRQPERFGRPVVSDLAQDSRVYSLRRNRKLKYSEIERELGISIPEAKSAYDRERHRRRPPQPPRKIRKNSRRQRLSSPMTYSVFPRSAPKSLQG